MLGWLYMLDHLRQFSSKICVAGNLSDCCHSQACLGFSHFGGLGVAYKRWLVLSFVVRGLSKVIISQLDWKD
jgi:hypothetical protein